MKSAVARHYWSHLSGARRVLDLGCATGDLGRYAPTGVECYGLDVNRSSVEQARAYEVVREWDLDQAVALPFSDGYFDAVVAKDILEHLQKPWHTVSEMHRVLRPGGCVMASVVAPRGSRVWDDYTHVRGFTVRSLRLLFCDADFEVVALWRMGGVPLLGRLNLIHLTPYILRLPPFDWTWTSSLEIKARRPNG